MVATVQGNIKNLASPELDFSTKITGLPVSDIKHYWPAELFEMARGWITQNLQDGTLSEISARVTGRMEVGAKTKVRDVAVDGTLAFEGATVHYLRPLPPVREVGGTMRFTERIDVTVTTGHLDGIALEGAQSRLLVSIQSAMITPPLMLILAVQYPISSGCLIQNPLAMRVPLVFPRTKSGGLRKVTCILRCRCFV